MDQFTSTIASTQYIDYVFPSFQDNNVISQTQQTKISNKPETIDDESDYDESIPSNNLDLYRKNKSKFYGIAANKFGNNRTNSQANSKIQSLRTRYEKENKEENMNKIFENRENDDKSDNNDKDLAVQVIRREKFLKLIKYI
ncbi:hypothetical protein C2G38_2180687 [Gigaspora rosea]|uniref:Uncharacterized protein n=1 Tax=Gigaspora rosea TaxID=44941 RepID=A0A397VJ13_9GLOM|nr:hypothetical protein C2G38_2180687 [Gigaspora rosea]